MSNIQSAQALVSATFWREHTICCVWTVQERIDVVSVENSPHHSIVVSINERSIVEVLCKLQTKLQITKQNNVILHLNWVKATSKSILH